MDLRGTSYGRAVLRVACVTVAAAAALFITGDAKAGCCYGTANWSPSGTYTGGISALTANSLNHALLSPFVVAPIWVNTSASETVEQGIGRDQSHGLHWYWAEASDCVPYQEHYPALAVSLDTTYFSKISYNSGGKWAVYRDGSFVGNSGTCHNATVHSAATGLETGGNSDTASGTASTLQKRGSDGVTWSYNWGGATLFQSSASASWITQYASMNWSKP